MGTEVETGQMHILGVSIVDKVSQGITASMEYRSFKNSKLKVKGYLLLGKNKYLSIYL